MKEKVAEAQAIEAQLKNQKQVDPEDVLVAPNTLTRQYLEVLAADHAIEDALYSLGKLLQSGKIDLSTYMKNVRTLSSEQFMKRALAMKIRSTLGLSSF